MKNYALIMVFVLLSCDGGDEDKFAVNETPDLSGFWQLSGHGEQQGCEKVLDNVGYDIGIADEWQVLATETGNIDADGFLEYELSMVNNPPFVTNFTGLVQGEAVSFAFEDVGEAQTVSYRFDGKAVASNKVKGRFSAQGPGACVTESINTRFVLTLK